MPKVVPHRSMKTPAAEALVAYETSPEANAKEYNEMFFAGRMETTGNTDQAILGMGQVAGLIDSELTAAEIMENIMTGFRTTAKQFFNVV